MVFDTPPLKSGRFLVLRGGLRHLSPKGLPGPLYVPGGVVVTMQARSAFGARMPADGQALLDHQATARTRLRRVRRIDRDHSLPSVCCFESKDAQKSTPSSVGNGLGEMV